MYVNLTDEWLDRIYAAYCEVWANQGKIKSADFVRAVFQNALVPHIAVRQGTIIDRFNQTAIRRREKSSRPENDHLERLWRSFGANGSTSLKLKPIVAST
jgi:hypothetical protein